MMIHDHMPNSYIFNFVLNLKFSDCVYLSIYIFDVFYS